jgi:group I intron endonuclease
MRKLVGKIYLIRNLANGKGYVGQTTKQTVWIRFNQHKYEVKRGSNLPIHRAMRKWGVENFTVIEVASCDPLLLDDLEKHFIKFYKTYITSGRGYNRTAGGYSGFNRDGIRILTEKGSSTLSDVHKGNSYAKGHKVSEEGRARMAEAARNRGPVTRSPELRARISATLKGHPVAEESRAKMSASHKGVKVGYRKRRPMSDEHKAKISASMRGKRKTPESIAKRLATCALLNTGDTRYQFVN